jgi:hypothetical protein
VSYCKVLGNPLAVPGVMDNIICGGIASALGIWAHGKFFHSHQDCSLSSHYFFCLVHTCIHFRPYFSLVGMFNLVSIRLFSSYFSSFNTIYFLFALACLLSFTVGFMAQLYLVLHNFGISVLRRSICHQNKKKSFQNKYL